MMQIPGLWIPVEQMISEAIRGMGGHVKMNRAPRNNMSRQLGGKRRGGREQRVSSPYGHALVLGLFIQAISPLPSPCVAFFACILIAVVT
eukprot:3076649-Pyramimonas_sp.AAC.1